MPVANTINVKDRETRVAMLKEAVSAHYARFLPFPTLQGIAKSELNNLLAGNNTNYLDTDPEMRKVVLKLCTLHDVEVSYKGPTE
jgi:hypothetical protein